MNDTKNLKPLGNVFSKHAALIAGSGLMLMAILAPIANFVILQEMIAPGDAETTARNITESEGTFRFGIAFFLLVALLDIVVAWALYLFLIPVNKQLSLFTAWLRLVYAAMLLMTLVFLIKILALLNNAVYLDHFPGGQLNGHVMINLETFNKGWEFSLIIFGFHLLLLGYLIFKAGYMRKILGILLIVAALGYLTDGFGKLLSGNYDLTISLYTFIGEVVLIFWLLIKGRKIQQI